MDTFSVLIVFVFNILATNAQRKGEHIRISMNDNFFCSSQTPFYIEGASLHTTERLSTPYSNNKFCNVTFQVRPPYTAIAVRLLSWTIADCGDTLTFTDNLNTTGLNCTSFPGQVFTSAGPTVSAVFRTNSFWNTGGFDIILTAVLSGSQCANQPKKSNYISCGDGYCVGRGLACDGVAHCSGAADEEENECEHDSADFPGWGYALTGVCMALAVLTAALVAYGFYRWRHDKIRNRQQAYVHTNGTATAQQGPPSTAWAAEGEGQETSFSAPRAPAVGALHQDL